MALVVNDTFTEASDTIISSHTGETGATWAKHPVDSVSAIWPPYADGADELRAGNTTGASYYYASGSPANADWKATISFKNRASAGTGQNTVIWLRMTTNNPINGYGLFYVNAATPYFRLYKFYGAGPSAAQLGSDYTMTLATDEDIDFYVVGNEIRVYKSDGTLMISATDSDVTSAGRAGFRFSDYSLLGATGGINISRLQAWDSATLPYQTISVGTASEVDTAPTVTPSLGGAPQSIAVGTATETDTATALTAIFDQTVSVGTATETNTAGVATVVTVSGTRAQGGLAWLFRSGSAPVSQSIAVGTATETDSAFAVTIAVAQTISVGTATETDTAGPVTQTVPGTVVIHPQGMVPGTVIGAYLRWEWRGPVAAKLNAGPGAVVQATTVSDDLTATFTLPLGEYVAYAADYPTRRLFFMVTE